ncbi:putative phosphatidylinositol 4-kinase [Gregarina niphandrodes]|uniref:Phosphatidylinositol 4-kinase n=1 Tax=Gregarina niphandrodes TaxID=110365 RepID=A0A023BAL1_GRENI|nr:putative phosphatidylinositol 4-kinase [Gregarina niphandrodes]EZG78271.1 putative phosphatidylinositol 4-kinase [Gregarina niphandrodes]|eukprot:XP_011129376.1 putative phosphatidylinositol 4-kinase [Gregarina niphandrodes]
MVPGAKVKIPTAYQKMGTPFQYASFAKEYHGVLHNNRELQPWIAPQRRCEYFNTLDRFITTIIEVSNKAAAEPDRKLRVELVKKFLESVDEWLFCRRCVVAASEGVFGMTGIALPFARFSSTAASDTDFLIRPTSPTQSAQGTIGNPLQVLRVNVEEAKVFSSRRRAPYLLVFELGDLDEDLQDVPIHALQRALAVKQKQSERALRNQPLSSQNTRLQSYKRGETVVLTQRPRRDKKRRPSRDTLARQQTKHDTAADASPDADKSEPDQTVSGAEGSRAEGSRAEGSGVGVGLDIVGDQAGSVKDAAVGGLRSSSSSSYSSEMSEEESSVDEEREMGVINEFKFEWSNMYVYDAILTTLRERQLYVPPFLDRPLTSEEWQIINDPALNTTCCIACYPSLPSPTINGSSPNLAGVVSSTSSSPRPASPQPGTSPSPRQPERAGCMSAEALRPVSRSMYPGCSFVCEYCGGTKVFYEAIKNESPVDPIKRSLGVGSRRASPAPVVPPYPESLSRPVGLLATGGAVVIQRRRGSEISPSEKLGSLVRSASTGPNKSTEECRSTPLIEGAGVPESSTGGPYTASGFLDVGKKSEAGSSSSSPAQSTPAVKTELDPDPAAGKSLVQLKLPDETPEKQAKRLRRAIWGELWAEKVERIRKESPFGRFKTWRCGAVLVKGGDDVRQELLASQLIQVVVQVFKTADLPLWLYPYEILVTGANCGIMEFVPDTQSIDAVKQKFGIDSLHKIFEAAFSDNLEKARKNFIESHAAYSLVSYLLQVKDRHNGNLLLTAEGRLLHIDYGFMLTNSPGYVNFETSPFKLSGELMAIIGGPDSENFEYFRELMVQGFLELRKYYERILLIVEMMFTGKFTPFPYPPFPYPPFPYPPFPSLQLIFPLQRQKCRASLETLKQLYKVSKIDS